MNETKPSQPINIEVGKTCVRVLRVEQDERTKREKTVVCHEGIVVQDQGSFVRVFNPGPVDKGGDISPEMSQSFPVLARRMWCELVSVKDRAFPIPAVLR